MGQPELGHQASRQASQDNTEFTEKAKAAEHTEKESNGASRGPGRLPGVKRLNPALAFGELRGFGLLWELRVILACFGPHRRGRQTVVSAGISCCDFGRTLSDVGRRMDSRRRLRYILWGIA